MNKKNILVPLFVALSLPVVAQKEDIKGVVLDRWNKPVSGAVIMDVNDPTRIVSTAKDGSFSLAGGQVLKVEAPDQSEKIVKVTGNKPVVVKFDYSSCPVDNGSGKILTERESTGSVASAWGADINKRSTKDVGQDLFGQVLGLQTLQESSRYAGTSTSNYIRGIQSTNSHPLIIVDGIEREITDITPEEVENVTVLKDAAAAALYGYKGANGVLVITTKHGLYNKKEIHASYEHSFNWMERRPSFIDGYTYASAVNEARANEGSTPVFDENSLNAYKNGTLPYNFPNVNWIDNTFRDVCSTDYFNLSFRGGGMNFRYYTLLNLVNSNGFTKNPNENEGYSTQEKYQKANIRSNWDIDLSPKTKLTIHLLGTLAESNYPGNNADLWSDVFNVPSGAFPVKTADGLWGGNSQFAGTLNPVAQSVGAAYSKSHRRTFDTDMELTQNFDSFLKGLTGSFRLAYDNTSLITEDHSCLYNYGMESVTGWEADGTVASTSNYLYTVNSTAMNGSSSLSSYDKLFNYYLQMAYNRTFGLHSIYAQARWEYEYKSSQGLNTTNYRLGASFYTHYGFMSRYFFDTSWVYEGSNVLAPGHKWTLSPTFSAAWLVSDEPWAKNLTWLNFLKLRASWGVQNVDAIPVDDYWEQLYQSAGTGYRIGTDFGYGNNRYEMARLASEASRHERAYKFNVGFDATIFDGLNLTFDYYLQHRDNIWFSASGKYTTVLGEDAPYEADGQINSHGVELGVDWTKAMSDGWTFNFGGNFTYNRDIVKNMLEEPRAYKNLVMTGKPYGQLEGLQAIGLFKDQADIDASPKQNFGTVYPGDIKYKDVNGDGVIDGNDVKAIGYNTTCPEIYYSFKLGAEYKGVGIDGLFQGTGHYSAMMSSTLVRPLAASTSISKEYYNHRWTTGNQNAKYPRLAYQSSPNNYRNSSFWMLNRSFLKLRYVEAYYNFPVSVLRRLKVVSKAKFYVRGIDLLCFDHIKVADPETYNTLRPLTRSVVAGLSFDF